MQGAKECCKENAGCLSICSHPGDESGARTPSGPARMGAGKALPQELLSCAPACAASWWTLPMGRRVSAGCSGQLPPGRRCPATPWRPTCSKPCNYMSNVHLDWKPS
jgi:hypothetical protein